MARVLRSEGTATTGGIEVKIVWDLRADEVGHLTVTVSIDPAVVRGYSQGPLVVDAEGLAENSVPFDAVTRLQAANG